jgi:hypothetical protein
MTLLLTPSAPRSERKAGRQVFEFSFSTLGLGVLHRNGCAFPAPLSQAIGPLMHRRTRADGFR